MDVLDTIIKTSAFLVPLLWKEGIARLGYKRSGKRVRYVLWQEGQAGLLNPRLRKLRRFFVRRRQTDCPPSHTQEEIRTAQFFLWNAGTEDLISDDFFPEHPFFIDLSNGEIIAYRVVLQTDDLVRGACELIQRNLEHPVKPRSEKVVALRFEYWPPNAGLVLELRYRSSSAKTGRFSLGGPIRGLRERSYLGTLWRIDLNRLADLSRQLSAARAVSWVSGIGFLVVSLVGLFHVRAWPISSLRYWATLATAVTFEWLFIMWNEKRSQLSRRVSPSLAYWLEVPQAE